MPVSVCLATGDRSTVLCKSLNSLLISLYFAPRRLPKGLFFSLTFTSKYFPVEPSITQLSNLWMVKLNEEGACHSDNPVKILPSAHVLNTCSDVMGNQGGKLSFHVMLKSGFCCMPLSVLFSVTTWSRGESLWPLLPALYKHSLNHFLS